MKKYGIIIFMLAAVLTISPVFAAINIFDVPENISVNDYSVVMQEETKSYIREKNEALLAATGSKVIFVTVPTTGDERIDEYAARLYNAWGVSGIGDNSSTFVLLATEDMQYWAIVGKHIESALTGDIADDYLLKYMEPKFAAKNFDSAIKNTFDAIYSWYADSYNLSEGSAVQADASGAGQEASREKKSRVWIPAFLLIAVIAVGIGYILLKRQIRLYALRKRKNQRVQSYKKYARNDYKNSDYEYFEYHDSSKRQ